MQLLLMIAMGLVIIGIGGNVIWIGVSEHTEAGKAKFRRDSMAAYGFVKPPNPIYQSVIAIGIGVVIIIAGLALIAFGPREFTGRITRRGYVPSPPAPPVPAIAAPTNTVHDEPIIEYPVQVPISIPKSVEPEAAPVEDTKPQRVETVSTPLPIERPDDKKPESLKATAMNDHISRYEINIALPPDTMVVQPETSLTPGTRLGAVWAGKWNFVTVIHVHDDGTVTVKWDGWTPEYRMVREDLAITNDTLASATERLWTDVTGKFQVNATFVESNSGQVKLRKSDTSVISLPISKMSPEDRKLIGRLSRKAGQ